MPPISGCRFILPAAREQRRTENIAYPVAVIGPNERPDHCSFFAHDIFGKEWPSLTALWLAVTTRGSTEFLKIYFEAGTMERQAAQHGASCGRVVKKKW